MQPDDSSSPIKGPLRVIAVGGGISGVNLAKLIPQLLNNVALSIYEKNPELGGTWYENRYVALPKCGNRLAQNFQIPRN